MVRYTVLLKSLTGDSRLNFCTFPSMAVFGGCNSDSWQRHLRTQHKLFAHTHTHIRASSSPSEVVLGPQDWQGERTHQSKTLRKHLPSRVFCTNRRTGRLPVPSITCADMSNAGRMSNGSISHPHHVLGHPHRMVPHLGVPLRWSFNTPLTDEKIQRGAGQESSRTSLEDTHRGPSGGKDRW